MEVISGDAKSFKRKQKKLHGPSGAGSHPGRMGAASYALHAAHLEGQGT